MEQDVGSTTGSPVTPIQWKAIRSLVDGRSKGEVAKELGVDPSTIHRWFTRPAFVAAFNDVFAGRVRDDINGLGAVFSLAIQRAAQAIGEGNVALVQTVLRMVPAELVSRAFGEEPVTANGIMARWALDEVGELDLQRWALMHPSMSPGILDSLLERAGERSPRQERERLLEEAFYLVEGTDAPFEWDEEVGSEPTALHQMAKAVLEAMSMLIRGIGLAQDDGEHQDARSRLVAKATEALPWTLLLPDPEAISIDSLRQVMGQLISAAQPLHEAVALRTPNPDHGEDPADRMKGARGAIDSLAASLDHDQAIDGKVLFKVTHVLREALAEFISIEDAVRPNVLEFRFGLSSA